MPFVLIVISVIGGGPYLTLHDFATKAACDQAKAAIERSMASPPPRPPQMLCVAKGAE